MCLIGFYSPKEKSGVTETSLAIYDWLKDNTSLKIAFLSNEGLEFVEESEQITQNFSRLTPIQQKKKVKLLKSNNDIIIYDASSKLNEDVLKLLSIVDRLFILGEDNVHFAESLHQLMEFNRFFDNKSKNLIKQLHKDKTYLLNDNSKSKVGFARSKADAKKIATIIYEDYSTFFLKEKYLEKQNTVIEKIKKMNRDNFVSECYELGISFNKALLFEKFLCLRENLGQSYEKAIEDLFPSVFYNSYDELLKQFQNEIYTSQIRFKIVSNGN